MRPGHAVLLSAALGLGLSGCTRPGGSAQQPGETPAARSAPAGNDLDAAPAKSTTLDVGVVTARQGTLNVQRSASAIIQAQRDSHVAAQSGGNVQAVLADEGERVGQGAVVVQLDDTQQRQALENARLQLQQAQITLDQTRSTTSQATGALQASVTSAQASLSQAQQGAQSAESLYRLGGISLSDLQAARATLAQAQSALAQARNSLEQNGRSAQSSVPLQLSQLQSAQASVRQAEENLARTAVRAPFAGTVASIDVEVGEFAAQGSPVFRLVDPGSIRVKFSVPSADAGALNEGSTLNLGYGGRNYVATVVGSPGIAGENRLVPITARVQGGETLPVGGAAQARYRNTLGSGLLIPSPAVQTDGGENSVYVAAGGVAQRTPVTVVAESGGQVAVRGLSAGQQVITPVPASLQDGTRIRIDPSPTGSAARDRAAGSSP
ncbi:efflux RND transporter periplasmic adaptor subunit [Deinococcus koreensis]|uniref:Efflux transporter periplasmic adaptor subunit n=1 Tax=Deinococcus koreensis TaxID=2054903 RepID=A0A2K3UTM0_9DEIO|nr:efflux RND transporter periplasmic adaptor subunit [Deinococcus koreensis]PNY79885.1 efflux transporter periplasmic adaptor subunit [Deinococcus koreensis]